MVGVGDIMKGNFDELEKENLWKKEYLEIKPEHLKLIQRMCVGWDDCEYGAPCIDPKRPYGNSSVEQDMVDALGFKELREGVYEFTLFGKTYILKGEDKNNIYLAGKEEEELCKQLRKLHEETEKVLQFCLLMQQFKPGKFVHHEYHDDWKEGTQ